MRRVVSAVMVVWCVLMGAAVSADDWPHWRGPRGNGVSPETGLPLTWGLAAGVAWRKPLNGAGVSTPVIWRDQIYVTSQIGAGVRRAGNHPTLVQGAAPAEAGERNLTGATAAAD